jgi:hypothetical protein
MTVPNKGGRPKRQDRTSIRTVRVSLRFSPSEVAILQNHADKVGVPLADNLRFIALMAPHIPELKKPREKEADVNPSEQIAKRVVEPVKEVEQRYSLPEGSLSAPMPMPPPRESVWGRPGPND